MLGEITMSQAPTSPLPDVDTLDLDTRHASALTRRALAWLVALLLLVAVSAALMVLFLRGEEVQEADRRRTADAQWLDQTLRFHLRRLETDLAVLALQAHNASAPLSTAALGGPWWQQPGQVAFHGWIPASTAPSAVLPARTHTPADADTLAAMLETTRGLQRAAYAGPLPTATPEQSPWLWLAVPRFEQGRFVGDYVAAVALDRLLADTLPDWFLQDHRLALANDDTPPPKDAFIAPINLPGARLQLQVQTLSDQAPLAPRAFFAVALVCLAGMLLALVRLWRDTARRQRTEARLQTQLALRSAMERSVPLGLCAWDRDGHLIHVNQAFGRMVGWPPQALLRLAANATEPLPYWPAEQGHEFECMRQGASDPDTQQVGREWQLQHRDGHRIEVLAHGAPLLLTNGEVAGWIGSVLDITERLRIERLAARQQAQLEASGRLVAVGEVASTLAHELNQPLGALSSFATGLLNRMREQRIGYDDIVPVVERIERMAEKTGRVIQRVNAFARRQEMSRQPLALAPFVARVAAGLWRLRRRDHHGAYRRSAVDGPGQPRQGPARRHQGLSVPRRRPGGPPSGRAARGRARADHHPDLPAKEDLARRMGEPQRRQQQLHIGADRDLRLGGGRQPLGGLAILDAGPDAVGQGDEVGRGRQGRDHAGIEIGIGRVLRTPER